MFDIEEMINKGSAGIFVFDVWVDVITHQFGFSQIAQNLLEGKSLPSLKELRLTFDPLEDFNGYEGDWGGAGEIGVVGIPRRQARR